MRHTRQELRAAKKLDSAHDYLADLRSYATDIAVYMAGEVLLACSLCVKNDMEVGPVEAVRLWHGNSPDLKIARLVNAL